jgi:uncharacterized membrane protein YhfC
MNLFRNNRRNASRTHNRIYARYEIAHTLIDFFAAVCFIIGSIMFFYEPWLRAGTWLFLIGSVLFAAKPTLRLSREVHLYRLGDVDDMVDKVEGADRKGGSGS